MSDLWVAEGLHLEGRVEAEGNLRVDGSVRGQIEADGLVLIGSGASCSASVRARSCDVHGELLGDVDCAEIIRVGPGARVVGDLRAPEIEIHPSALVDGRVDLGSPSAEHLPRARRVARLKFGEAKRPRPPIDPVAESATLSSAEK